MTNYRPTHTKLKCSTALPHEDLPGKIKMYCSIGVMQLDKNKAVVVAVLEPPLRPDLSRLLSPNV
jgi:hypothetical protein